MGIIQELSPSAAHSDGADTLAVSASSVCRFKSKHSTPMACWGSNLNGELDFPLADHLSNDNLTVIKLVAGHEHFCAIFEYLAS